MVVLLLALPLLAIAVVVVLAAMQPNQFRVERQIRITAPASRIFALINDFHAWEGWSPWDKIDPALQRTYSGATAGVGAVYAWQGNSKVGSGRMEITASEPYQAVVLKLDFNTPIEAHNITQFTITESGDTTHVVWAMYGPSNFMTKIMCVFNAMDRMVGKDFEKGLAALSQLATRS
jgi:hypothetical protein